MPSLSIYSTEIKESLAFDHFIVPKVCVFLKVSRTRTDSLEFSSCPPVTPFDLVFLLCGDKERKRQYKNGMFGSSVWINYKGRTYTSSMWRQL